MSWESMLILHIVLASINNEWTIGVDEYVEYVFGTHVESIFCWNAPENAF